MDPEFQGLESIVNSDKGNHTILKTIGRYIANNQMLVTGTVLWLPRLALFGLYTIDFKETLDASIIGPIEYFSWIAASVSYIPWGLHGAGLKTFRETCEYYKENGLISLGKATIKGILIDLKYLIWDMPKYAVHSLYNSPQYLTYLYDKAMKRVPSDTKN